MYEKNRSLLNSTLFRIKLHIRDGIEIYPSRSAALSLALLSSWTVDSEPDGPCFSIAKNPYFAMSLYLEPNIREDLKIKHLIVQRNIIQDAFQVSVKQGLDN